MAINSQGSYVDHNDGSSPSVWGVLEEVTSIQGPDGSAAQIDTTHLLSTGKEYLPGLGDPGQLQLECNFTAGTKQMALKAMFDANSDPQPFRVHIPTTSAKTNYHVFSFLALVSKWSLNEAVDDKAKLSIALKISGAVNYALI